MRSNLILQYTCKGYTSLTQLYSPLFFFIHGFCLRIWLAFPGGYFFYLFILSFLRKTSQREEEKKASVHSSSE